MRRRTVLALRVAANENVVAGLAVFIRPRCAYIGCMSNDEIDRKLA